MSKLLKIFTSIGIALVPNFALAHSFGRLYNLPVPFWIYLYGGGAAMVVSFLFIGYFLDKKSVDTAYVKKDLSQNSFFKFILGKKFIAFLKYSSLFLFIFTVITGLFGANSVYSNWNMTFFWIIFVLGLTYFTAIFGNIYTVINPWKTLTDWMVGKNTVPIFKYPSWLGYYPAVLFYFIFIWIELVGESTPLKLSMVLIAYTIINDLGVVFWGRNVWYKYCEFFGVFFRLIGKIALFEYEDGKIYFRPPFMGILKEKAENFSLLLFIIFMLSSTAFDGFKETIHYTTLYFRHADEMLRPILGNNSYAFFETISLALSPFIFLGIYLLFIYLAKIIVKSSTPLKELALYFTFSLIPIAFVYNIAHYYTLIFTEAPGIIRLASDPFGLGHNFFHTAGYYKSIILPANFIWHSQVTLILLGHIVSVYLTHAIVLKIFSDNKRTLWSHFPMLILMVAFTLIGLWILAQPVTGGTL